MAAARLLVEGEEVRSARVTVSGLQRDLVTTVVGTELEDLVELDGIRTT